MIKETKLTNKITDLIVDLLYIKEIRHRKNQNILVSTS